MDPLAIYFSVSLSFLWTDQGREWILELQGFSKKNLWLQLVATQKLYINFIVNKIKITNGSSWQSSASLLYIRRGCEFFTIYESAINKSSQWLLWPEKQPQLSQGCFTTVLGF